MTSTQAVQSITSKRKPYIGIMPQSTFSSIVIRFNNGTITLNKLEEFLNKFGYVKRDDEWIKTKVEQPKIKRK